MHILHIEDEADLAATVRMALSDQMTVRTARTLAEAREYLRAGSESFDLVLLDLNLPDSSGLNTLRALEGCALPIVVLSALEDEETIAGAAEIGAEDYLYKAALTRQRLINRLRFAYHRHQKRVAYEAEVRAAKQRKRLSVASFELLKPYIACGVGSRTPFAGC